MKSLAATLLQIISRKDFLISGRIRLVPSLGMRCVSLSYTALLVSCGNDIFCPLCLITRTFAKKCQLPTEFRAG